MENACNQTRGWRRVASGLFLKSPVLGKAAPSTICRFNRRTALARMAWFLPLLVSRLSGQQSGIERKPVESSVLAAVGYDVGKRLLEIEFRSGAIYRYLEVPEEIHRRLLAAESKGRFFGAAIRDKFRSERVTARTAK